ncbi:MAG: hypothetical protein ACRDN6_11095 [Gaiellaceae bacterium]
MKDADLWYAATLGLYLGGAVLIGVAVLSFGGRNRLDYAVTGDVEAFKRSQSGGWVYVLVGLVLIGLGILLDSQRPRTEPDPGPAVARIVTLWL